MFTSKRRLFFIQFSRLKYAYIAILIAALLEGCYRDKPFISRKSIKDPAIFFPFFLSQKTMIVNQEENNEIEGHYLKITEVINDSTFRINLPDSFYLNKDNYRGWMIGWPTDRAYYDAGNENLREISALDLDKKLFVSGKLLRGEGRPHLNQRITFWNRNPSGFRNCEKGILLNPGNWKLFAGKSVEFGSIIFDSTQQHWIMYIQEVDTLQVNIYAAISTDLENWAPVNKGKPILNPGDFNQTMWAGKAADGITPQTARLYSAIRYQGRWYLFLSGYAKDGRRNIGLVTAIDPLNGPFEIRQQPIISPDNHGCDMNGCFYPKVCMAGKKFLIYYDGVGIDGTERLCMAESGDLRTWKKYDKNPVIDHHYGWRSGRLTSEPNYVSCINDTVWIMIGGYKKYNTEFTLQDSIERRTPFDTSIFSSLESEKGKDISGNVMDAESGVFMSTDGGHTFSAHINNPIWLNDYSDTLQNDHLGGDFFYNDNHIIYQAKSETQKRYNILLRVK